MDKMINNLLIDPIIINDQVIRKKLAIESHYFFFHCYFSHYIEFPTADFQREIFSLTENDMYNQVIIVSFRNSAKSSIVTTSYPTWAVFGKQKKKFVLIVSQTQQQARFHLSNIKRELEENQLLINDFGIRIDSDDEWRFDSLYISKYNARIHAISIGESQRGFRQKQYRPDLIICDDIEDLNSVKTMESRAFTFEWFNKTLVPMGSMTRKIMVVGNLLHEDSFMMRIKEQIKSDPGSKIYKAYPIIDDDGNILWPGKYPSMQALEKEKSMISESAWMQEYMLKIVSNAERIVHPEWIRYYDSLPKNYQNNLQMIATGVDLAIKKEDYADYTAMVSAYLLCMDDGSFNIYILPNPVYEKMNFPETIDRIKKHSITLGQGQPTNLFIEDTGYQSACIETLMEQGFYVEGFKPKGQKESRVALTTPLIQNGTILFSRKGNELLIQQLIGMGFEKHDDLADAFAIVIIKLMEYMNNNREPQMIIY